MSSYPKLAIFPENLCMTPEFRLVAACSWLPRSDHAVRQSRIIASLTDSRLNWNEVASLATRHGVVGQFCTLMGRRGWVNIPPETKVRLKNIRAQQVVRALSQVSELTRIGRIFSAAGISSLPLKGVALSQELYGDPCMRSSGDLDILLLPDDMEKAEEHLTRLGYRNLLGLHRMGESQQRHIIKTFHHHEYMNDARGVLVELHWRSYLWTKEQVAALWESSSDTTWLDAGLKQLSPVENILFLADHGARHDWLCLKWLADVAMLMQDLSADDWLSLQEKADFFDLRRVMGQTATLLEWFYGIQQPEIFKSSYLSDDTLQKLSLRAASRLTASADQIARQTKRFAGFRQALRIKQLKPSTPLSALIRGVVIIRSDFVELPLPDSLFWLYLPLRPFFWFKRHFFKN